MKKIVVINGHPDSESFNEALAQSYIKSSLTNGADIRYVAIGIINDILDFSKIESGKMELSIEKSNIYDMLSQVINVILYQSRKKNIELLLNVKPDLPKMLYLTFLANLYDRLNFLKYLRNI
ncbi:NAD(P)H-dependent oxidoreductase [uncultured Sphingobacterium sp.]|uniref:NAD(P)H-dependent oxidoreductase n=1 Tax=uncultured Sphingobacterium sp. TaxID=182688 RepID=UPI0025DB934F|nr:NAD(P)H-dependent oxidoreductase [uncultured Sphingobacterium sp.]